VWRGRRKRQVFNSPTAKASAAQIFLLEHFETGFGEDAGGKIRRIEMKHEDGILARADEQRVAEGDVDFGPEEGGKGLRQGGLGLFEFDDG
jgi:hypothetical protein